MLTSLDDESDDGTPFRETVQTALIGSGSGEGSDYFEYSRHSAAAAIDDGELRRSSELECAWPAIQTLANALRDGLDNAAEEPGPYTALPANRGRTMKRFEMPGPDVVALVQPLLEDLGKWRYLG